MVCTIDYIDNWLKANLTEERYQHSLGTAECAKSLAKKYGLDTDKAYLTGLIHDCAKCLSDEEFLTYENLLEDFEKPSKKTWHAPVGAYIAKTVYGIDDEEILSAIRWHTVGKKDMTCLEKIIFLADKIEPNTRDKEYREKISNLLKENEGLNKALLECYKQTIKSLVKRNLKICPVTVDIYNNLLK